MRHSPFTAVYDACVLYPAPLRDLLMWLGLSGRFRARWSVQIHQEWKRNLLLNRRDLTAEQVDRTSALMDRAIPDALVTGHEPLIAGLQLPDADDRHVLAAAIRCSASVIVTFNLKDFPSATLAPFGIEAQHPDEFIENLFDLDQAAVVSAAQRQRAQLTNPGMEVERYLEVLLRQGLVQTVKALTIYRTVL
ncbi:PIN domain-containing protein [Xanthomonas hortorum]|uniref:PIN domain-containing protein n=2 Tax=Xanthomonas hortorum pv. pelargonii TaxID=453602 RepID=A0AAW9ZNI1_9XANT|nr:PIN domain-containing protein [Xanthomonas hortorum]MCU1703959.1 PIN domain-containing protein [Xanthomonas hortorum pv. pelargonii]MCU1707103.1 PIN domain-containing protein [Xanthomonas hortorum pv. pelargonii]MCU1713905.1 PIN domain-containing protein [Xanthomonas hortorum pv. pelargonii]MDC8632352.1 PIN domain-containing protein [Xanthomonas hortorum pv. pelargonii]MDC8646647.1 PIN domain-containing protein [Xanthomonas hortorum pv. pelargonii]